MFRPIIVAGVILSTSFAAFGQLFPVDAIGNLRVSSAPYVQPATRPGRLSGPDLPTLTCMVSCPGQTIDVKLFRDGNGENHKVPGDYNAGDVTICCDRKALKPIFNWFTAIKNGATGFARNLTLDILGSNGKPTCRFLLYEAWPHQINWSQDGTACVQFSVTNMDITDP
jgi:hypothetical protein